MEKMTANEAKQKFGELLDKAQRGPVQITKHGRVAGYVISSEDYEEEQRQKEFHLRRMLEAGYEDIEQGRVHSFEDVKAEVFKTLNRE